MKKIVAYPQSELYAIIDNEVRYENMIQDIADNQLFADCKVKVGGVWYDNNGDIIDHKREMSSANLLKSSLGDIYTFPDFITCPIFLFAT